MFIFGCAQIKLEDRPIIKKIKIGDEVVCIYEVKFLSGDDRCIDPIEYRDRIEPTVIEMPHETFMFFKKIALQACALANASHKASCEQDVKGVDSWVKEMIKLSK